MGVGCKLLIYFFGLRYFQGGLRNFRGGGLRNFRGGGGSRNFIFFWGGVVEKFSGGFKFFFLGGGLRIFRGGSRINFFFGGGGEIFGGGGGVEKFSCG